MEKALRLVWFAGLTGVLGGCASHVPFKITQPHPPSAKSRGGVVTSTTISRAPFTEFGVWLGANADPNSFHASLGGQDITAQFTPMPTPDAGSVAPMGSFSIAEATNAGASQPPYSYTLTMSATCTAKVKHCGPTTRSMTFVPPQLVMNAGAASHFLSSNPLYLRSGLTATVNVAVQLAPRKPIEVTLFEHADSSGTRRPILSLDGNPVGDAITVTIPAGRNWASFTVAATAAGSFTIDSQAPGCVVVPLSGRVAP